MSFSIILILFSATFFTGILAYFLAKKLSVWLKYLLSFSGAYLFGLTITHLLPEMYEHSRVHDGGHNLLIPGLIIGGFFLQIILEYFSQGAEHGHIHIKEGSFPISLFIALMIHATLEGSLLHGSNSENELNYLFGLTIHKIPIAVVLAILLRSCCKSKYLVVFLLAIFAMASPLGMLLAGMVGEELETILMALVAGSFLHISTTILFESSPDHKFNLVKFLVAIFGASLSFLIL